MMSADEIPHWASASAIAAVKPSMNTSNPTSLSVWVCGSKNISARRTPSAWALRKYAAIRS